MLKRLMQLVLCAGCLFQSLASAQEPTPIAQWQLSAGVSLLNYFLPEVPKWQAAVAVGAVSLPRYGGARRNRVVPVAAGELRFRDIAYLSSSEGVGMNFLGGKSYRVGANIGYDIGRVAARDPQLSGFGDIDAGPSLRMYGEKVLFPFVLRSTVVHALAGDAGWSVDLATYLPVAASKQFLVLAGPSLMWSDAKELQRRFGVSASQSSASGLPTYTPHGGLRNVGLGFSATWFIDDHWFMNATGAAQKLLGDAADSPLTQRDTQTALILITGYRW